MPIFDKYANGLTRLCKEIGRIETVKAMFAAARLANPSAVLLINGFDVSPANDILVEGCLEAGIAIDAIGIQSHMHQGYWGVEKILQIVEAIMKKVTRSIDLDSAQDLLERVPRACICFASDRGPQSQPIVMLWHEGGYLAGIPRDAGRQPGSEQEVVLLIDEGIYYFDLRAIYIRGQVKPAEAPKGAPAGCTWLEVVPLKTVAWDYGTLREVGNES